MRLSEIRPSRTPNWWIICSRFSSPGAPLGICRKSCSPASFCPLNRYAQWSVEIAWSTFVRTAFQSTSWLSFGRGGGVYTNFAPSKSGRSRNDWSMKKYCVQVSPWTSQPFSRAIAIGSADSLHETCTT